MIVILPASLLAQDSAAAILRSGGIGVLVNKNRAQPANALFPDDLIETQRNAVARIEASGSTADVHPETIVQFEGNELVLEHGGLSVNTSHGLIVRVGCVTVTPVNNAEWTQYDVTDLDGKVTVSALKKDVNIDARSSSSQQAKQPAHSSRVTVIEGEQRSREERCEAAHGKTSSAVAGKGAIMSSPWAVGAAATAVGGLSCLGLCHNDDPVSPAKP